MKLGISTTSAYYTDTIIKTWIRDANKWAASYKKWPFTEGRINTTYTGAEEWSFEGLKADSVRLLYIGGKRFEKITFEDYQIYKEDQSSGTSKIWSDFGRTIFVNTNSGVSGTLTAYAQFSPTSFDDFTDDSATSVFSDGDEEGNTAIVEEVLAYANFREKKLKDANYHHGLATQILDGIWDKVLGEQFNYKTKDRGMFKRFDVLMGGMNDDLIHRDQFPFG